MKIRTSTRLRPAKARAKLLRRRRRIERRATNWARGLELTTGITGLINAVGAPLLRLLTERTGLRAELSQALGALRPDFLPGHDRGQVLTDTAVAMVMGAVSVGGAAGTLGQCRAALGQVASAPTIWRAITEVDGQALETIAAVRAVHRRRIWQRLADRPEGFPWIEVAGRVWADWIVIDVDASLVETHSDKEGSAPTYKRHVYGLHPLLVTCANTGECLVAQLRAGNAGSNTVCDHVQALTAAIAQIPEEHRQRIIFRADGAGATKGLLEWIVAEAANHGYTWYYSVGFDVTEPVRQAITEVPDRIWAAALTPDNRIRRDAHVTEITGVLTLADGWPDGIRIMARTEPLHPRNRKQASPIERERGQRFQATATNLPGNHYPKLDAFHRNHAGVESIIKQGKDLGLRRMPGHAFAFNQTWCTLVALATDLVSWLRLLALDHHETLGKATPALLRALILNVPARVVHHARRRLIRIDDDHPHHADLTLAWTAIQALGTPP